jgi:hypothetical protein
MSRYTVGYNVDDGTWAVVDKKGWIKGWYQTQDEALEAARLCESGLDAPPRRPSFLSRLFKGKP